MEPSKMFACFRGLNGPLIRESDSLRAVYNQAIEESDQSEDFIFAIRKLVEVIPQDVKNGHAELRSYAPVALALHGELFTPCEYLTDLVKEVSQ